MNKLPKVFANTNLGKLKNNETIYYDKKRSITKNNNINFKINQLFKSSRFVYKINVKVTTEKGINTYRIIGKSNNNLITIDNELIPIDTIIDIEEV
jgi:hypothetical protein